MDRPAALNDDSHIETLFTTTTTANVEDMETTTTVAAVEVPDVSSHSSITSMQEEIQSLDSPKTIEYLIHVLRNSLYKMVSSLILIFYPS